MDKPIKLILAVLGIGLFSWGALSKEREVSNVNDENNIQPPKKDTSKPKSGRPKGSKNKTKVEPPEED